MDGDLKLAFVWLGAIIAVAVLTIMDGDLKAGFCKTSVKIRSSGGNR